MFFHKNHKDLINSIEAIGAGFAVYEYVPDNNAFELVSCNILYEDIIGRRREKVLSQPLLLIFPRYVSKSLIESFMKCKKEQIAIETEVSIDYKGAERYWRSIISPIVE